MIVNGGLGAAHLYDCFVIGSGPAGISLALALEDAGKRVLIFETGEVQEARSTLSNSVGYGHFSGEYWNVHSSRVLGGTSNVWAGWCTTLCELDLANPAVGVRWPISRTELLPYWRRAAPILDLEAAVIDFETPLIPGFLYRPFHLSSPTRFGSKYLERLRGSSSVVVAPGCTVVKLDANEARSSIVRIEYVHHRSDARLQVAIDPAQSVVLAAGGIGNARLLLQPRADGTVPVGDESGQVGKFLMEHPHLYGAGECAVDVEIDRFWPRDHPGRGYHAVIADTTLSLEHGLYACNLQWSRKTADHQMARYLSSENGRTFYHYGIAARSEMLPSPTNRVFMTGERDRFGLYRPGVRCVLDARDFLNVELTLRALGDALIRTGKGRVRVNNDRIYNAVSGGGHIMGTTRMGQSRSTSVVDPQCRVHGYGNLFVAGSSVFPSGGYANPTLTIVALALRLADTLAEAN